MYSGFDCIKQRLCNSRAMVLQQCCSSVAAFYSQVICRLVIGYWAKKTIKNGSICPGFACIEAPSAFLVGRYPPDGQFLMDLLLFLSVGREVPLRREDPASFLFQKNS